jgi:protein-disulfide isomerase
MDEDHKLTKKEKRELRKLEWQEKEQKEAKDNKIQKFSVWAIVAVIFLVVGFVLFESITTSSSTPAQTIKIAPVSSRDITTGNPKAKVTIIEYADFQCPSCALYHPMVDQLLNDFKDKIYYVYRMFPLTDAHQNSLISAQAAYAAYQQNKFFQYDDLLFGKQADWENLTDPTTVFIGYAKSLNLDLNKFQTDINSSQTKKYVQDSENQALNEGIFQTPSFFINGKLITNPNSYADFKTLINNALQS